MHGIKPRSSSARSSSFTSLSVTETPPTLNANIRYELKHSLFKATKIEGKETPKRGREVTKLFLETFLKKQHHLTIHLIVH